MNQKLFLFLVIFLYAINLRADKTYFTVIAKSGLSIRAEKSLQSERLAVVPFGEKVLLKTIFWEDKITVEEIEGFWISVEFGKVEGFMFSGFLFPGPIWEIHGSKSEEDVSFLSYYFFEDFIYNESITERTLNFYSYDSDLKYFGVKIESEKTVFEKVEFVFEINYKRNQNIYDYWRERNKTGKFRPNASTNGILMFREKKNKDYDFFIGVREIELSETESVFLYDFDKKKAKFKFLDIGEELKIDLGESNLKFSTNTDSSSFRKSYLLKLELIHENQKYDLILEEGLDVNGGFLHGFHQTPSIAWVGHLNQDDIPDILLYKNNMHEGCGWESYGELHLSKHEVGKINYDKISSTFSFSSLNLW